jgi:hypothetical protein
MTILAFGTSLAELSEGVFNPATRSADTTAARMSPNVSEGAQVLVTDATGLTLRFAAQSELWASFYVYFSSAPISSGGCPITFYSGTTALFQIDPDSLGTPSAMAFEYWTGSSWTEATGEVGSYSNGVRYRFDVHVKIADSGGVLEWYTDGALTGTFTGDTLRTALTTVDGIALKHGSDTGYSVFSAVMVADEDTRGITYIQKLINGAGALSDWTGTYAEIDEAGANDSDLIQASADAQTSLFTKAALPAGFSSGYQVIGLGVSARAQRGSSGPANIQMAARHGTTNGFSASKSLETALNPKHHIFTQNPATAAAWTYAEADAAQVGVRSAA